MGSGSQRHPALAHRASRGSNRWTDESGQAAAEFVILLPVMMTMLMAIIGFGDMIATNMDMTSATRDAARTAVAVREEEDPEELVRAAFARSIDRVDNEDVELELDGTFTAGDDMVVTADVPYDLDVFGIVVWSGNIRAESVARIA